MQLLESFPLAVSEESDSDMSGHVEGEVIFKVPLFHPCSQKFWSLFSEESLLQEVEQGLQRLEED